MVFGSLFAKNGKIVLETADNKKIILGKNLIQKLGLKIFGIPHIGLRVRAYNIFSHIKRLPLRLLDVGCGPGIYVLTLSYKGHEASGIDVNEKKIEQAIQISKKLGLKTEFKRGSIYNIPYKAESFDAVICSDVLEHLKDDEKALKECWRVLKTEGFLLITAPTDSPLNRKYLKEFKHERLYTKENLMAKLKKNGFAVEKSNYYLSFFGRLSWQLNRKLFKSKILAALTFYPLFFLTFLDSFLRLKNGEGLIIKCKKIPK